MQPNGGRSCNLCVLFSLTLADLGGVGERILHAMPDVERNFYGISVGPGHERNLVSPYLAANCGDCIAEGQDRFRVPSSSSRLELSRFGEVLRAEGDDGI